MSLQEKQKLLDEIEDLTVQLTEEQENKRKMGDKLSQERHQFQKEKESTQEVSRVSLLLQPFPLVPPETGVVTGGLASAASPEPAVTICKALEKGSAAA